eukprot:3928117-Pleurochrysis_carterae.AAC.3
MAQAKALSQSPFPAQNPDASPLCCLFSSAPCPRLPSNSALCGAKLALRKRPRTPIRVSQRAATEAWGSGRGLGKRAAT